MKHFGSLKLTAGQRRYYPVGNEARKCYACEKKRGSVREYTINDKSVDLCPDCVAELQKESAAA